MVLKPDNETEPVDVHLIHTFTYNQGYTSSEFEFVVSMGPALNGH